MFYFRLLFSYSLITFTTGSLEIKQITNCYDSPGDKRIHSKGRYQVLTNFVQADRQFECHESITFAAPADYTFLENLETLVEVWQGPISVAIYAPGYDFRTAMDTISFLRECKSPLIKEYASFHLFFEWEYFPGDILYKSANCSEHVPDKIMFKTLNELTFPINVARNVAKEASTTHFVLVADIELIPTPNFIEQFLDMVTRKSYLFHGNSAFVLPIFEITEDQTVPRNKTELQKMHETETAFVFHKMLCLRCHQVPEGDAWLAADETENLDVFSVGKRQGEFKQWEPFYVSTREIPNFDERLSWEGQRNKMTQGYLMCMLDYEFKVLNNAFLTHKPGIKKEKTQLVRFGRIVRATNAMLKLLIKEYVSLYGVKEECYLFVITDQEVQPNTLNNACMFFSKMKCDHT